MNKKNNNIIKQIRKWIKSNSEILLKIEKYVKIFYFMLAGTLIIITLLKAFIPYFVNLQNIETPLRTEINELYKNQMHISEFNEYYKKNAGKILKVIYPDQDFSNYFQIAVKNTETNTIDFYKVYKNINEEWTDFQEYDIISGIQDKTAVGLYYGGGKSNVGDIVAIVMNLLFLGLIIFFVFRFIGAGTKSPLTLFSPKEKYSFDDIGGLESQKEELAEIVTTLKALKKFKQRGVRPIRGILFYGPPGTGKTLIAKTIASQIGAEIFIASANDFGSKFINEGPQKVKKSFKEIEKFITKHKKDFAILFIDELDSILKERGTAHSEDDKVVNAFLDRIDGIEGSKNIVLIGATNHLHIIDEASLSRFDRKIEFKLPTKIERLDIANKIIAKRIESDPLLQKSNKLDLNIYAGNTEGMSGRDIENQLNEVHRRCVLHNKPISNELIQDTFMDMLLGRENKGIVYSKDDLDIVTYHELGHAFIAHLNGEIAHTVTIISRGQSLGSAWILPKYDSNLKTPDDLKKSIQRLVAGRMAEKYFRKTITTGASNDYERATLTAISYFKDFNFKFKNFSLGYVLNQNNNKNQLIETEIFNKIEENVKKLITEQENIVLKMIEKHESAFNNVLDLLLDKKIIYREDFEKFLPSQK